MKTPGKLTGIWNKDFLDIVSSQIGYQESLLNYTVDEGNNIKGYSIYGDWYDEPYSDWNLDFVRWCLDLANVPSSLPYNFEELTPEEMVAAMVYVPRGDSISLWIDELNNVGLYYELNKGDYEPIVGEIVFVEDDNNLRVGIVSNVNYVLDEEGFETDDILSFDVIEGDYENSVAAVEYSITDNDVIGCLSLPLNPNYVEVELPSNDFDESLLGSNDIEGNFDAIAYLQYVPKNQNSLFAGLSPLLDNEPAPLEMRDYLLKTNKGVVVKYHPAHKGDESQNAEWFDLPTTGTISPDSHFRIEARYAGVDPTALMKAGYQIRYYPGNQFKTLQASGEIKVDGQVRGTVSAGKDAHGEYVTLSFDPSWVQSIIDNNNSPGDTYKQTIAGDFYFQSSLNLSEIDKENGHTLNLGPITIDLPISGDASAEFGQLDITKQPLNLNTNGKQEIIKGSDGKYYLEYMITIKTGDDAMDNVVIRDVIGNLGYVNGYVGIDGAKKDVRVGIDNDAQYNPYSNISAGQVYLSNVNANPSKGEETNFAAAENGKYMIWNIGHIGANQTKTLTYYVEVAESYIGIPHQTNEAIVNTASAYSKGYPHNNKTVSYLPNATADLTKNLEGGRPVDNGDGTYTYNYVLTITTPTTNEYDLKNVKLTDSFIERGLTTSYNDQISYDVSSIKAFDSNNQEVITITPNEIKSSSGLAQGSEATQAFSLDFGDLESGKTYTIKYSMKLNADHAALKANGNVGIYNRARLTAQPNDATSPISITYKDQGFAVRNQTWESKTSPGQIREGFTQNVTGNIYDATGSTITGGLASTNFEIPAGAFKYVVNINTGSANNFDVSGTQWNDTLTNNEHEGKNILKLIGYMRVDVYSKEGVHKETRWVKIDGNTGYNFNGKDIGLPSVTGDHYTLTYYAKAQENTHFGIADVNNSFSISGNVGLDGGLFTIPNFTTTIKSKVEEPGFEVPTKFAWYYNAEDTSFSTNNGYLETGALYWYIEQGGTFIPNEMKFQESVNYSKYNHYIRKNESFLGFYTVNLEKLGVNKGILTFKEDGSPDYTKADVDKLHLNDFYKDYESFMSDFNSADCDFINYVPNDVYTSRWSSGNERDGWSAKKGKYYDFNVEFTTEYSINSGEKLYLLIRTEPKELPAEDTTIIYDNKVNYLGPKIELINGNWPKKEASQTLYGPHGSLEKTSDGLFRVTTNSDLTKSFEKWNSKNKAYELYIPEDDNHTFRSNDIKVDSENLFVYNNGVYVVWNITLNKLGEIDNLVDGNGDYTVIDSLPSGVELAYVRGSYINQTHVKTGRFFGENAPYNFSTESADKFSVDEGWVLHNTNSYLIGSNGSNLWNTKYYTRFYNGENQIGIYIPRIYGAKDGTSGIENRINFQIVCRVTDPNIYMQDVTFANVATLFNRNGQEIESDTSIVKAFNGNLSKTDLSKYANSSNEMQVKIPYSIEINEDEADMESDTNIISVGLVDHMSKNLSIDMDSLKIYLNYKDLSNPGTLVYDGGVEKTNIIDNSVEGNNEQVYYATDEYGNRLYWQHEAVIVKDGKQTTPFAQTAENSLPVISTIKKSDLDINKITYGKDGDQSYLYYVGVGEHEEYTYGPKPEIRYEYVKALDEVTSGNYKIQVARPNFTISNYFATGTITSGGLDVAANENDAYLFKITRISDEKILIQNEENQYLKLYNSISYSNTSQDLKIVENTDNVYASTKAQKLAIGLGVYGRNDSYLNLNNASGKLKTYSLDIGSAVYLKKEVRPDREITPHSEDASNKLYWNGEAELANSRSDYPVLTTGDNRPTEVNGTKVIWHEMTYNSGDTVIGNVNVTDADFQLKDNSNNPLFFELKKENDNWVYVKDNDGLNKMVIESEKNSDTNTYKYEPAKKTQIVVAVEDYYDEFGNTDGSKVVKFYNLPDSVSIGITYDVNASISSYANQSYSNETYWENHDKSEGGSTDSGEMQYTAGGSSQVVTHGAVKITKYDGADTSNKLANAEFTLYRAKYVISPEEYNYVAIKDTQTNTISYKLDSEAHDYVHSHPAIFRVDANGNHIEEMVTVRAVAGDSGHKEGELLGFLRGGALNETTKLYEGGEFIDISNATGSYEHQLYVNPDTGKLEVDYTNGHGEVDESESVAWIKRSYKKQGDIVTLIKSEHGGEPKNVNGCTIVDGYCKVILPKEGGYERYDEYLRSPGALGVDLTNSGGVATYGFADDETSIHYNKVYAIVETVAPDGFDIDPTPHFFVIPSENESGQGENYFFHSNESDFPEEVHIVRMSEGGVLTYYLNVYDYKANVQVKKAFAGNGTPVNNYKPGTYTFGIWDSKDVVVDTNGNTLLVDTSKRIDINRITYVKEDFGYYTLHRTGSQYINWSEYKEENNQWFIRLHSYSTSGVETVGQWSAIKNLPTDVIYGVLPGRNRYATFKNLSFNHDYYVYELDKNLYPIINNGETVDGNVFDVVYGNDDQIYIPGSDPQRLVVEGNRVTTYRSDNGTPMVPILIATNRSYSLSVNKSFITNTGIVVNEGVSGTYKFGIWKQSDWTKDAQNNPLATTKEPFDVKTIEWSKTSKDTVKTVVFDNLLPGNYYVFELDDNNNPLLNNSMGKSGGKNFSVAYTVEDTNGQKVVGNGITINADDDSIKEIDVTNKVYYVSLPSTGGIGNYTYLALCMLVISISICIYTLNKRSLRKEVISSKPRF